MNLNQITKRIGELSAELLTLHNDLAFLVEGGVARQPQPTVNVFDWKSLKSGDLIHLQSTLIAHGEVKLAPGIYKVDMVENPQYKGTLPFSLVYDEEDDGCCWIRDTGTFNSLFRKV